MYAKLTETTPGVWGLPVARIVNNAGFQREKIYDDNLQILVANLPAADQRSHGFFSFTENRVDLSVSIAGAAVDVLDGGQVTRTYPNAALKPDADLRAIMYERLGAERWRQETGGITVSSMNIPTAREDRGLIKHALDTIGDAPATMPFKVGPGQFVDVNKATLQTIWNAVAAHVEHCFDQEQTHAAAIASATGQAILDYDITTGWTV